MLHGHGDDACHYPHLRYNFSSNIYAAPCHDALLAHLREALPSIAAYPEPDAAALTRVLARRHGVDTDCVLVTAGVTEAIYVVAQAAAASGLHRYGCLSPTFSEYASASEMFGLKAAGSDAAAADIFWLCNPNNPTGDVASADAVMDMSRSCPWLIVDQAYAGYTLTPAVTAQQAIRAGNVVLLHSLTKSYAIPGLRVGYVVAAPELTARLRRFMRPWSVGTVAMAAARWLVQHDARVLPCKDALLAESQRLYTSLAALSAVDVHPTATTFMLLRHHSIKAAELKERLAHEHGLLIRDASNFDGLSAYHFRVAAQTRAADDALIAALSSL